MSLSCFKAYDIRGRVPDQLNEELAWRIGRAFVTERGARSVLVGRDARLESPPLSAALIRGITEAGADVIDIGLCGTEEVYFGAFHRQTDGGIMVTASHNPMGYNGMKLVGHGATPISSDTGLSAIRDRVALADTIAAERLGTASLDTDKTAYIDHLLTYLELATLKPLKIVADAGNGCAGPVIQRLQEHLPFDLILIRGDPDGSFPGGVPNPLLPEMRATTARAVVEHRADFGIAWDGDFDRCFFFDANGRFIEGYYLVGLLAQVMLARHPGAKIVHDPRLTWNTIQLVQAAGGAPVQSRTGHAFIKERMRREDAVYGGEMSAHHYFRDFAYCDSGMIPWLLIAQHLCRTGRTLAQLVDQRMAAFPCSGEINYRVKAVEPVIGQVLAHYAPLNPKLDRTDGISVEFSDWRFNLRASNTEPLLRLNLETRADADAVSRHLTELDSLIGRFVCSEW
jgi:phosphomannomutase/phosphoglucomutase